MCGIAYGYLTPLVVIDGNLIAQKYRLDILGPHVVPLLQTHNVITTLQQDNATSHVACVNLEYLQNHNVDFIDDWRSKSPDLNPIEHIWDNLDRRVRRRPNPPNNVNELRAALLEERNNISQADIYGGTEVTSATLNLYCGHNLVTCGHNLVTCGHNLLT